MKSINIIVYIAFLSLLVVLVSGCATEPVPYKAEIIGIEKVENNSWLYYCPSSTITLLRSPNLGTFHKCMVLGEIGDTVTVYYGRRGAFLSKEIHLTRW